jgi:hypothetical protein
MAAAFVAVWMIQRRGRRPRRVGLPRGLTVVTGPDCRWCDRLLLALERRAPGLDVTVIGPPTAEAAGLLVRSIPTAVVVDGAGAVVLRRSGTATIEDVDRLIEVARSRVLV